MAKRWLGKLYIQVLIGIALAVLLAQVDSPLAVAMKPLGDAFIKLIKMLITPIIFCTIVTGIAHVGDMKHAGKLGLKALIYFEIMTTLALVCGLVVANITSLGANMHVDIATLDASALNAYMGDHSQAPHSTVGFLLNMIPQSFFSGVINGDLLQTLVVAILFAWAIMSFGKQRRTPVIATIETLSSVFFRMVELVMFLAPIGAFGAMAYTIGTLGVASIGALAELVAVFFAACLGFVVLILGPVLRMATGIRIFRLLRYIREELLIVLGTSSSESVLPRLLEKMEALGCKRQVVGMVLPTGYSFNLDGTSLYFTLALVFIANATGTHLGLGEQVSLLLVLLVTSKGAAGVTGAGFIVLVGTLASTGTIPVAAAAIVLGIDRFMSTGRALTNVVGNCIATLIIARWENALDKQQAKRVLNAPL